MSSQKNKRFILGNGAIPDWIEPFSKAGRIKFHYDDEINLTSATIQSPTGIKNANVGDTIVKTNSGLIVIPKTNNAKEKGGN